MSAHHGLLTATLIVLALSAGAISARDIGQDEALQLRQSGKLRSLESLLHEVHIRYPDARLLEAELEEDDGQLVYELEVLTSSGEVRELELNAVNGVILKDEAED